MEYKPKIFIKVLAIVLMLSEYQKSEIIEMYYNKGLHGRPSITETGKY